MVRKGRFAAASVASWVGSCCWPKLCSPLHLWLLLRLGTPQHVSISWAGEGSAKDVHPQLKNSQVDFKCIICTLWPCVFVPLFYLKWPHQFTILNVHCIQCCKTFGRHLSPVPRFNRCPGVNILGWIFAACMAPGCGYCMHGLWQQSRHSN